MKILIFILSLQFLKTKIVMTVIVRPLKYFPNQLRCRGDVSFWSHIGGDTVDLVQTSSQRLN